MILLEKIVEVRLYFMIRIKDMEKFKAVRPNSKLILDIILW